MKTKNIYCPVCGAPPGGKCRDINNYTYMIKRSHKERIAAAKAIKKTVKKQYIIEAQITSYDQVEIYAKSKREAEKLGRIALEEQNPDFEISNISICES